MDEKKVLEMALDRFKIAEDADNEFRRMFKEDLEFISDDQWTGLARQQRTESGRPCMTMDRINPALRQIVNEQRMNKPRIEVLPKGDDATDIVANTMQGLIRAIEYDSAADSAYDRAGWYAAAGGIGYIRVRSEYEDENTFDQVLRIEAVADPMNVFYDPNSVQSDGSDCNWAFIVDSVPKTEFQHRYPNAKLSQRVQDMGGWQNFNEYDASWITQNNIRVAEYYYKEHVEKTLYQVRDNITGQIYTTTDKPPQETLDADLLVILNKRPTLETQIVWCLMTGTEILDSSLWPGKYIPVLPVYGEDYFVDGKRYKCGAVRRAKDAQKMINFTASLQAEIIDLNAKAPYIGAAGQFDTFEDNWRDANRKNFGYLEYNPTDINGNPAPPPQRNAVEAPIVAVQQTKMQSVEDIKAIFGVFDASLGAQGNETSGVAILARKEQTGISNYHYYDNLVRTIRHLGRILVDIIPFYYDTTRIIRIVKPNDDQELVLINGMDKNGKMIDLNAGRYDVVVQTGPGYSTQRQEMVDKSMTLMTVYPQAAPLISDLVVQEMSFDGAKQIAKRLRAAVPPEVLMSSEEEISAENAEAMVQTLQAKLKQNVQALEALNAHAAQVESELERTKDELKLAKMKGDIELNKATLDAELRREEYSLDAKKYELDFLIKEQEVLIQKEQLKLEQAKLAVAGMDKIDKELDKEAARFDAIDVAQPSDLKASATGI